MNLKSLKFSDLKLKNLKFKLDPFTVILVSLAMVSVFYLYNLFSTATVHLDVAMFTEKARLGEQFDISANIRNVSGNTLTNAEVIVTLSDGLAFPDVSGKVKRIVLGEIGRNGSHEEIVTIAAVPSTSIGFNESREVKVLFNYNMGSVTAKFRQEEFLEVPVEGVPLGLEFEHPNEAVSGEEFESIISYEYTGAEQSGDLKLQIDYPEGFMKTSSDPKSGALENVWDLGALNKGARGKVSLKGRADLPENSNLVMTAKVLMKLSGKDYVIASKDAEIRITPSPLSLRIFTDAGAKVYRPGEVMNYSLSYRNNSDSVLNDLTLRVVLNGQMYDANSIRANGAFVDVSTKTINWNRNSFDALAGLAPGTMGSVTFSVAILPNYPARVTNKALMLRAEASVESRSPELVSRVVLEDKITGNLAIQTSAFFRDASSLILNSGSLPPRVGVPIEFTIHWVLDNFSTNIQDVEVRAKLGDGVVFTGSVKSNTDLTPGYDAATNEVIWRVSRLFATNAAQKPEGVFQVRVTPADQYIGNYMPILWETFAKGKDSFTGIDLQAASPVLTTRLEADRTVNENDGRVIR